MDNTYSKIQELLHQKADYHARLNLLPYDGTPEIKDRDGQKYLYVRKRVGSRLTSTYVDAYSDELYQLLLRNSREARELKKHIRENTPSVSNRNPSGTVISVTVSGFSAIISFRYTSFSAINFIFCS